MLNQNSPGTATGKQGSARSAVILCAILLVSGGATVAAMRHTSTTFDEIVMVAGGARGYQTGDWTLAPEHPPLVQYLYGILPHLAEPRLPPESAVSKGRYPYSQDFFWDVGNNPEQLAFLGRLPAVACALLLTFLAYWFTRRHYGEAAGLLAATMVAFLPDLLGHGGVAYNDVPVTAALFAAAWILDALLRAPTVGRAVALGAVIGLALGVKNSAIALAPIVLLLLLCEAVYRRGDRDWFKRIALAAGVSLIATYVMLVLIYRGDVQLHEYRYSLSFVFNQVTTAGAPAYLLGQTSEQGWWFYFPVAFVFKTSLGLHLLLGLALIYFATRLRQPGGARRVLSSPLRVPLAVVLVFGVLLIRSKLNIGFRYAMPVLPMLAVLAAVGATGVWRANWRRARVLIGAATIWLVVHPLSYYPNFLTYISEYGPGRSHNYRILVDSSMDWGQGLIQLRDFMREQNIPRVYLSYYGSGRPAGYGIAYEPIVSFLPLPKPAAAAGPPPQYLVISATNLAGGSYFSRDDPLARFRAQQPLHVIGQMLYVFEVAH